MKKRAALQKGVISSATVEGNLIPILLLPLWLKATNVTTVWFCVQCNLDISYIKHCLDSCEESYSSSYLNRFWHHLWDGRPLSAERQVITGFGSLHQSPSQEKPGWTNLHEVLCCHSKTVIGILTFPFKPSLAACNPMNNDCNLRVDCTYLRKHF